MTELLFRADAYLAEAGAVVTAHTPEGGIIVDRTVFYPTGGGQPGDIWSDRLGRRDADHRHGGQGRGRGGGAGARRAAGDADHRDHGPHGAGLAAPPPA